MPKITLDWKTIHDFMVDAFVGVGVPADDAEIVTDVLLTGDTPAQTQLQLVKSIAATQ